MDQIYWWLPLSLLGIVMMEVLFDAVTPLGFRVHTTQTYWQLIVTVKHPVMYGREADVEETLRSPGEIRRSRRDPNVYLFFYLFYREERPGRWVCVVVKRSIDSGFVITTYLTDVIKEGDRIWNL